MPESEARQPQELQTIGFELEQEDVYGKYLLSTPLDILFVLGSMLKRGCMATVYFNHGRSLFLTWVLAVSPDGKHFTLDIAGDQAINREALKAQGLIVTANLDNVKIQFALAGLQETSFEDRPAFIATLPTTLLRLQRREYFRLETSLTDPIRCHVPIPREDGSIHTLDLILVDISGGGLSLMAPMDAAECFRTGMLFPNCRLQIPDEHVIAICLCVRSAFAVMSREGQEYFRVGCEYINLPGARLNTIQRYITRIERQRKARASGLN